jgi:dipeptidyl aminopeptidase/acylaminoacyl peptidase
VSAKNNTEIDAKPRLDASWTIQDILSFQIPMEIAIHPDGTTMAYVLRTLDYEKGEFQYKIWGTPTDSSSSCVQWTRMRGEDMSPLFSPTGDVLAFLSTRPVAEEEDEDEERTRLWRLPLRGGEADCLTEELENIYDYVFAPDGKTVYVITDAHQSDYEREREEASEENKRDVTHEERSVKPKRICAVDLATKEFTTLLPREYGLAELTISPDGNQIVYVTNYTGLNNDWDAHDIWQLTQDADTSTWAQSPLIVRVGACRNPQFSPDAQYIAYIAPRHDFAELSQSDLWLYTVADRTVVNVTESLGWIGDVQAMDWQSNTSIVASVEQSLYAPVVQFTQMAQAATQPSACTVKYISDETSVVRDCAVAPSGAIGLLMETADNPADLYIWTPTSGSRPLTNLHQEKSHLPRADMVPFTWTSFDGMEMEGVLVTPNRESPAKAPYPLLLDIHGGPAWHATLCFSQNVNSHWLASIGYAVFLPNYRGGIGYGQAYIEANRRDLGGGDYHDIRTGVDAVIATGLVDEQRMGVMGGSYGGYMTNWIIGHESRFKAAVSECGIWSLFTDFGGSSARVWETMYMGRYYEEESLYLERSPARYVTQINTPVLLIHGDGDDTTPLGNSHEMYNALLEASKVVEFVHFPREGHGIREPRHMEEELTKIKDWFEHFIPTEQTKKNIPCGIPTRIESDHVTVEVTVVDSRVTDAYQVAGEDFAEVLAVQLKLVPLLEEPDEKPFELTIGDIDTNNVFLIWPKAEPFQRESVLARHPIVPLGLAFPASRTVMRGQVTLTLLEPTELTLLFPLIIRELAPTDSKGDAWLHEALLEVSQTKFYLTKTFSHPVSFE